MDFLFSVIFGGPMILIVFVVWKILDKFGKPKSPHAFVDRNQSVLRHYQAQISALSSEMNNPKTDIRTALKCAQKVVDCYLNLQVFCTQSKGGEDWFHTTCDFPSSQAKKALADYTNLLSELQEFRSTFYPVTSSDDKIQSDWTVLSCDHDSYEQLIRQKRSIKTLPVYVNYDKRYAFFLSNDMNSIYSVSLFDCTCPDHEERVLPCKHMYRLFYELTVGTDYAAGVNVTNLDAAAGLLELSDEDKVSYIKTVRSLCGRGNRPLTTRKFSYIKKSLQAELLLQSDTIDYVSLLDVRTKDDILISLRNSDITDCYPSWTKVRIINYLIENHRQYLMEEYKDFTAVTIPPALEPWCMGIVSVINSKFSCDTEFLQEWERRFEKLL